MITFMDVHCLVEYRTFIFHHISFTQIWKDDTPIVDHSFNQYEVF